MNRNLTILETSAIQQRLHTHLLKWLALNNYTISQDVSTYKGVCMLTFDKKDDIFINIRLSHIYPFYQIEDHVNVDETVDNPFLHIPRGLFLLSPGTSHATCRSRKPSGFLCGSCRTILLPKGADPSFDERYDCPPCAQARNELQYETIPAIIIWSFGVEILLEVKNLILEKICALVVHVPPPVKLHIEQWKVHLPILRWIKKGGFVHKSYTKRDGRVRLIFVGKDHTLSICADSRFIDDYTVFCAYNGQYKLPPYFPRGLFLFSYNVCLELKSRNQSNPCGLCAIRPQSKCTIYCDYCNAVRDDLHARIIPATVAWLIGKPTPTHVKLCVLRLLCEMVALT